MDLAFRLFEIMNAPANGYYLYVWYVAAGLVAVFWRLGLFGVFQSQRAILAVSARPIESLAELKKPRITLVAKACRDYCELCELGLLADPASVAQKHADRLGILGWGFTSMLRFLGRMDAGLLLVGLGFALVFEEERTAFGLSVAALFVLLRVFAVFDAERARERLIIELCEYLRRQVGKFFAPDVNANLIALRTTLDDAIRRQSDILAASMRSSSEGIAAGLNQGMGEIQRGVEFSLAKLQDRLLGDLARLEACGAAFTAFRDELARHSPECIVQSYEDALAQSIKRLGEGFGSALEQHTARTMRELTNGMEQGAAQILKTNQELAGSMKRVAEELGEARRSEVRMAAAIRDQVVEALER